MARIAMDARYITNEAIRRAEIACLSAEMNLKKAYCEDSPSQFFCEGFEIAYTAAAPSKPATAMILHESS
jgi:hypothetical protein